MYPKIRQKMLLKGNFSKKTSLAGNLQIQVNEIYTIYNNEYAYSKTDSRIIQKIF